MGVIVPRVILKVKQDDGSHPLGWLLPKRIPENNKWWWRCEEQELLYAARGNVWFICYGQQDGSSSKNKNISSRNSFSGYSAQKKWNLSSYLYIHVPSSIIHKEATRYPLNNEQTHGYYSALKTKDFLKYAITWIKLEDIRLNEISLSQKDKERMFHLCEVPRVFNITDNVGW